MCSMIAVFCWADVLFFRSRQMFRTMSGPGFRSLAPFAACTRCSAEKNHGGLPLWSFDGFWLTVKFPWRSKFIEIQGFTARVNLKCKCSETWSDMRAGMN